MSNYQLITEGFQILRSSLAPYIARSLIKVYGDDDWWRKGVWERLYDYQRRSLPETGTFGDLVDSLDVAVCLLLLDINWRSLFSSQLSRDSLSWIKELRSSRNSWAHFGGQQPTARDTWRSLDTMSLLCREIDQDAVAEIELLINGVGFEAVILPGEDDVPGNDSEPTEASPIKEAHPALSQEGARRFLAKRDWTAAVLREAVAEWCEDKGRAMLKGFDDLEFADAAEAALAMPAIGDRDCNSFRKAADTIVFQLDDEKMMAITYPNVSGGNGTDKRAEDLCAESRSDGVEPNTDSGDVDSYGQKQSDASERFEYLPKRKASWQRDDILDVANAWAATHARCLPAQIGRWHLATLADTVLSVFPGQSDMVTRFIDSQPETLFVPDARKLRIVTHM